MSIRSLAAFVALACLSPGCASSTQAEMTGTPIAVPSPTITQSTVTPPAPATHAPSPLPTAAPVDGVTTARINVRVEPSTAATVLGVIPAEMRVEITGRDPGGNWWQINYAHPDAVAGKGWVTVQYITTGDTDQVPVIGGEELVPDSGAIAVVQQQINIRSGPGTGFNSLGTLNPQDVVSLTGKDPHGAWLQIDFPAGPAGKGWISAAFVQAQGAEDLPIIADSGEVIGTGTPTGVPSSPTPTLVPAWDDGDSPDRPVVHVIFEPSGTQKFSHSGDVSSPRGDAQDWIAFRPYGRSLLVSLDCKGSNSIEARLHEDGSPREVSIRCGAAMERVVVEPGSEYLLRLQAAASGGSLLYTSYTITITITAGP